MILDERTEFCDATALNTGGVGTYTLGDQIDIGALRDLGGDKAAYLRISVDTLATGAGNTTGEFQLVSADDDALTTNPVVHASTGAIAVASLTAGAVVFDGPIPRGNYKRYVGIRQLTGGAAFTAGKINANLAFDTSGWKAYADATN